MPNRVKSIIRNTLRKKDRYVRADCDRSFLPVHHLDDGTEEIHFTHKYKQAHFSSTDEEFSAEFEFFLKGLFEATSLVRSIPKNDNIPSNRPGESCFT